MKNQGTPVTQAMARFARATRWESLPAHVQRETTRALVNWVGCAVGGARTPLMDAATRGVMLLETCGDTPVIGRGERCSIASAALLGCMASTAHTFDDTHLPTITHPTGPVAAALLAVAHRQSAAGRPLSGSEFLAALTVGIELECRLSNAIAAGGKVELGWYMTGLSGGVGAASAVGRVLGLDEAGLISAIGLAAAQACGLRATHGSMAIAYVPGVAARNGVCAAYMAAARVDCGAHAIDGPNGLLQVLSPSADAEALRAGLGEQFELMNNAYKPYPCGIVIHPAIDACLTLADSPHVASDAIERVEVQVHADALNLCWRKLPDSELDAQVSLYHWIAAALVFRAAAVAQGELAAVRDPRVRSLQELIDVSVDPGLRSDQAVVSLRLRDGRSVVHQTVHATGSVHNPMSDEALAAKFIALSEPTLGDARCRELLALCHAFDSAADAAEIFQCTLLKERA